MSVLIYLQCCSGIHISSSYRYHRRLTPLRWPLLNRTLLHSDTTLHFNHGETLSDLNANVVSCNLSMLTLLVKPLSPTALKDVFAGIKFRLRFHYRTSFRGFLCVFNFMGSVSE